MTQIINLYIPNSFKQIQYLKQFIQFFVKLLENNKYATKGVDYIEKFGLNKNEFQQMKIILSKNYLRYQIKNFSWQSVEEKLIGNASMLCFFVEYLLDQGNIDVAFSIHDRHNLIKHDYYSKENLERFMQDEEFTFIQNDLIVNDKFCPTEMILSDNAVWQEYLDLKIDFGICQEDVIFISSENNLQYSCEKLLNSKIVGLDSEFITQFTKLDQGGISIFQFACDEGIFIFDVMSLNENLYFKNFIDQLFKDNNIIKVGHTIQSDLTEMRKNLQNNYILNNYCDISDIYKVLEPSSTQTGLAHIVQYFFSKSLSKYEQCSGWQRRPLRQTQLHYAAMDALICLKIFQKSLQKFQSINKQIEFKSFGEQNKTKKIKKSPKNRENKEEQSQCDEFFYAEKTHKFWSTKSSEMKFLVDNMIIKLAKLFRSIGIDCESISEKNWEQLELLAKNENRIIITRDQKFFQRKKGYPCYLLTNQTIDGKIIDFIIL